MKPERAAEWEGAMADRIAEVFSLAEVTGQPCWPMLRSLVDRAARAGDEGPTMAAWTTLAFHHPNTPDYWRRAVPAALAGAMAEGHGVTPAGWRALACLLAMSVDDLKDRVSYSMLPDGQL